MRADTPPSPANEQVVLHPILFAFYPAVYLYVVNRIVFDFSAVLLPGLTLACLSASIWWVLSRATGSAKLAAVLTSIPLLTFFSYHSLARSMSAEAAGSWSLIIAGSVVVAVGALLALLKWRFLLDPATYILNVISLLLVAGPLLQAGFWNYGAYAARDLLPAVASTEDVKVVDRAGPAAPDIYYFVLDGYGREDVLRSDFGFDNSGFISELEDRGFYVADQAVSNYPVTVASVTSTMNLSYIQDLLGNELGNFSDRRFLREKLDDSRAVRLLRSAGYKIVSFSSEYPEAQIGSVDVDMAEWWFPSQFALGLLQMTPIPDVMRAFDEPFLFDLHRYRTTYPLDQMGDATALEGPKFVYMHLFYGHPPFVFGENGEPIQDTSDYTWDDGNEESVSSDALREDYGERYAAQVRYLNGRMRDAIDEIDAGSDHTPVIIMHGDHGPGSRYDRESLERTNLRERYSIFYAARLPGEGEDDVYASISPVNGLRVVMNRYLDAEFPLLQDRSFFNTFSAPYSYTPVDLQGAEDAVDSATARAEKAPSPMR